MPILEQVDDDLRSILPQFFDNIHADLQGIETSLEEDLEEARRLAHGIKGSAGSFGIAALQEQAKKVEECAKNGDRGGAAENFDELKNIVARAESELD